MARARGFFVTLEGGEGSGKTLQITRLREAFRRRGVPCLATLEPGGTRFGREVRNVLLSTAGARREPVSELLLYLADRYQHLKEIVEPALEAGTTVLCDRYHDATRVYQGLARGLGIDWIEELSEPLRLAVPDLTLVLDLEIDQGVARARARNLESDDTMSRFEGEDMEFHRKVREGYHLLADREPERIVLVDASGDVEAVQRRLVEVLQRRGILPLSAAAETSN